VGAPCIETITLDEVTAAVERRIAGEEIRSFEP
jgi:hypothetical protein